MKAEKLKDLMRSACASYEAAGVNGTEGARAMREGLNRIEELEAKLDDKEAECRYLRAQVNMVIPVLEEVQDFVKKLEPQADQGYTLAPALYHACILLNRLKEDRDE